MADVADAEVGFEKEHAGSSPGRSHRLELELTEATGVFLAWCILVTTEGVIRSVLNANPSGGLTPDEGFPPLALLIGGLAEVMFGSLGLLLAMNILLFKQRNPTIIMGFLIFQSILGWFVFITFVLAVPFYEIDNLEAGRNGLSLGQDRFLIFLGLVSSVSWCAALQSGQFVLAARVMSMMKGNHDTIGMHRLRAIVWISFAMLAGIAMFITGIIFNSQATGDSPFLPPTPYPPHVVIYPETIAATGALVILWSLLGLAAAVMHNVGLLTMFNNLWYPIFFINIITFGLILGKAGPGPAFAGAQHTVLSFAFTALPVVFTRKMVEWKENGGSDDM